MSEPIVYVDKSEIRPGKLDSVRNAIPELVTFIESNVPRVIAYSVYLNGSEMTVVQIHPDSASLEFHMRVGAPAFAKFKDLLQLRSIDLYGQASDALRNLLADKASMLGKAVVTEHQLRSGFTRFEASTVDS